MQLENETRDREVRLMLFQIDTSITLINLIMYFEILTSQMISKATVSYIHS